MNKTEKDIDTEQAMDALVMCLEVLGWKVLPPETDQVQGLIIGTPEFIDAWLERSQQTTRELQ